MLQEQIANEGILGWIDWAILLSTASFVVLLGALHRRQRRKAARHEVVKCQHGDCGQWYPRRVMTEVLAEPETWTLLCPRHLGDSPAQADTLFAGAARAGLSRTSRPPRSQGVDDSAP
jgi:hypothetical protein